MRRQLFPAASLASLSFRYSDHLKLKGCLRWPMLYKYSHIHVAFGSSLWLSPTHSLSAAYITAMALLIVQVLLLPLQGPFTFVASKAIDVWTFGSSSSAVCRVELSCLFAATFMCAACSIKVKSVVCCYPLVEAEYDQATSCHISAAGCLLCEFKSTSSRFLPACWSIIYR